MGSGAELKEVRAVYHNGTLRLLDELELPDGVQVRLFVEAVEPGNSDQAAERKVIYPTRVVPAERLHALTGLIEVGGDALADSEALYDSDRD
jgi:predicted DNA-binding antitoxin AbrB/MazE fold protein